MTDIKETLENEVKKFSDSANSKQYLRLDELCAHFLERLDKIDFIREVGRNMKHFIKSKGPDDSMS